MLKDTYKFIGIEHKSFAKHLDELREHKAWEKVPIDYPYGSESKMLIAELGKRKDKIDAQLDAIHKAQRSAESKERDDEDRANQRAAHVHIDHDLYVKNGDVQVTLAPTGNRIEAMLRRLRHAAEAGDERVRAIYDRVLAGEITAHAGMIEAGFRKKQIRKPRLRHCPNCGHEW